jgi:hypothetical protein
MDGWSEFIGERPGVCRTCVRQTPEMKSIKDPLTPCVPMDGTKSGRLLVYPQMTRDAAMWSCWMIRTVAKCRIQAKAE